MRPLKVPVFEHLYNLYDSELEYYISYWKSIRNKEGTYDSFVKCDKLRKEYKRRHGE